MRSPGRRVSLDTNHPKHRRQAMELTSRETWTLIHGLILGSLFLLAFAGGLAGLYSFRTELVTAVGILERLFRLRVGVTGMAVLAWATVITGTWVVYPWYRETIAGKSLAACGGLQAPNSKCSPKEFLLSNTSGDTSDWHEFGMEWKEHIAWMAPMLATAAAVLLAAGFGIFILGLLTTLAEASTGIKDGLQWNDRVGPLSGKTIIATAVFFGAWGLLAAALRRSEPPWKPVVYATGALVALGLLMTFPTFFQAFAPD